MNTEQINDNGDNLSNSSSMDEVLVELKKLKDKVKELTLVSMVKDVQLPVEVMKPIIDRSFRLGHPPMECEIRHAMTKAKTMVGVAEYLGVSVDTLKWYCKLYDEDAMNNGGGGSGSMSGSLGGGGMGVYREPLWKPTRGFKSAKVSQSKIP